MPSGVYKRPSKKPKISNTKRYGRKKVNEYAHKLRQAKIEWLRQYKGERCCRDCGESDPIVLQFHHLDPTTKNPRMATKIQKTGYQRGIKFYELGWEDMFKEVEKCIVLCANCHLREENRLRGQ